MRKQDKGRRDSRKSLRILGNPTEYPSCDGGILRQRARAPAPGRTISRRFRRREQSGCSCRPPPQHVFAAFPTRCCACVVLGSSTARGRRSRWSEVVIDLSWIGGTSCSSLCSRSVGTRSVLGRLSSARDAARRVRPRSDDLRVQCRNGRSRAVGHSGPHESRWAKDSSMTPVDSRGMARLYLAFASFRSRIILPDAASRASIGSVRLTTMWFASSRARSIPQF